MNLNPQNNITPTSTLESTLFTIRGSLDGDQTTEDFSDREQYIGLKIHEETFYLSLSSVNEIIMLEPIRFVPGGPKYIEGVLNLRGTILPAINLAKLMDLPRTPVSQATRTIIVNYEDTKVGLLVDGLSTVVGLLPSEIEERSIGGQGKSSDIISKIAKHENDIIGILNADRIVQIVSEGSHSKGDPNDEEELEE